MLLRNYGAHTGLEPVLIADMFGVKHFGMNYSALAIPVFASSLVLGQFMPGLIYDDHGKKRVLSRFYDI